MDGELTRGQGPTPKDRGYQLPAEWAPHEATWLSWPNFSTICYPFGLRALHLEMLELIRILCQGEKVYLNIALEEEADWILGPLDTETRNRLEFFQIPTCEPWNRDLAPTFLVQPEEARLGAVDWEFNSWGEKFHTPYLDTVSKGRMAAAVNAEHFLPPLSLEGGALETDGEGTILSAASAVDDPHRNPGLNRRAIDRILMDYCCAEKVLWLEEGMLEDETDGHIDTLARFIAPGRVALVTDSMDPRFGPEILQRNYQQLAKARDAQGRQLEIVELPPAQPFDCLERITPVTHANFYIGNTHVLVPAYGVAWDERARDILKEQFPDREVVLVSCPHIAVGLGGIHCLTQQVPALVNSTSFTR